MKLWPNGSTSIPTVTSEFGWRTHPLTGNRTFHYGIDLVGFPNNCAADDGTVTFAEPNDGAGLEVRVLHDDGTETRYKHNARFLVSEGDRVTAGQPLGVMGTTGDSTGVHCHFETRNTPGGAAINPREFMTDYQFAGGTGTPIDGEDQMLVYQSTSKSADGVVPKGLGLAQVGGGPFRPMSSDAFGAHTYFGGEVIKRTGDQLRALIGGCGMETFSEIRHVVIGNYTADVPILTGTIVR